MKTVDDSLIQTATQKLVAEFQPEQIWLFGSHAWGTPNEDSDVDLMVIVPSSDERPIRRMQRANDVCAASASPKTCWSTPGLNLIATGI